VIAGAAPGTGGFGADDVARLLDNAPGEIVVLRPDKEEQIGAATIPRTSTNRREQQTAKGSPINRRTAGERSQA
jgi:hypothetical protein